MFCFSPGFFSRDGPLLVVLDGEKCRALGGLSSPIEGLVSRGGPTRRAEPDASGAGSGGHSAAIRGVVAFCGAMAIIMSA